LHKLEAFPVVVEQNQGFLSKTIGLKIFHIYYLLRTSDTILSF